MEYISQHIEALIFAADQPISTEDIQGCLEEVFGLALSEEEVLGRVEEISNRFRNDSFAFELIQSGNCFQFLTKPAFHDTLNVFLRNKTRKKNIYMPIRKIFFLFNYNNARPKTL